MLRAKIVTVSDGVSEGTREDRSGDTLVDYLGGHDFAIDERIVIPDGIEPVARTIRSLAADWDGLLVTTGGTGFGPRDLTPEGTRAVLERDAPGMAEAMRLASPLGRLSRQVAGTIGATLILNLPGSTKGCVECLDAVIDVVPHALELLRGERPH